METFWNFVGDNFTACWLLSGIIGYIILSTLKAFNKNVSGFKGIIRLVVYMLLGYFSLCSALLTALGKLIAYLEY